MHKISSTRSNFAKKAMPGALLGDALGVPYEFRTAEHIPMLDSITMPPPAGFRRSHPGAAVGAWSDDGAQMLCVAEALIEGDGSINQGHLGEKFLAWLDQAYHQAGGLVFDVGGQTRLALDRFRAGVPIDQCSGDGVGNGSLMRVLPCAFLSKDPLRAAVDQGMLTHKSPLAQACCAIYTAAAIRLADNAFINLATLAATAIEDVKVGIPELAQTVDTVTRHLKNEMPTGSGYALNSLLVTFWALERCGSFTESVRMAISLGGDTDTHASLVGGLAALRFGLDDVPAKWLELLDAQTPTESRRLLNSI